MKKVLSFISVLLLLWSCGENKTEEALVITAEEFHSSVDKVTDIMIHDIFSPPVASRVYVYPT